MGEAIIKTEHLYKAFNLEAGFFARNKQIVYAVNDVSLTIDKGMIYGLVGESGCGKSTTARMLVSMYTPTSGTIRYSGILPYSKKETVSRRKSGQPLVNTETCEYDVFALDKKQTRSYREKVKYIFQDPARSLNPRMSVYALMTEALRYSSLWTGKEDARQKAVRIIEEVGLSASDLDRHPSEFSGGQRQRISIARGLIMEPDFLICDEVVSALDVSIQGQILNLLQDIRRSKNISFLFIAHDLKVSSWFCDRIGVMYRGMLVEEAPAISLHKEALHPYTQLLFDGAKGKHTTSSVEVMSTLSQEHCCPFAHRCKYSDERCKTQCPDCRNVAPDHMVRCWKVQ
ncbi:MAG: ABC transporter ATP-binding protein [Treponema sp.]|nr:ABC transporter ATP-binding protein [Treponema sp.]